MVKSLVQFILERILIIKYRKEKSKIVFNLYIDTYQMEVDNQSKKFDMRFDKLK